MKTRLLLSFFVCLIAQLSFGQNEARLLRFPAVYGNQVIFSYAGDLYTVDKSGGTARKMTNHNGYEMFPKFSHDGKQIAFSAQYDGNTEVYLMDAEGGPVKRITYTATLNRDDIADRMGPNNIVMDWTPDDKNVIYRSRRFSFNSFKGQLFKAPVSGDLSEDLPFSVAGACSYNETGNKLAYNRVFREFRTWKYYRGGMADDIWIYDVKSEQTANITNNVAQDIFPMYHKDKVYFLSDRDRIMNLFEYDTNSKQTRKVTNFTTYDVKFPSLTKDAIAFENGGFIYVYDLNTQKEEKINITINEDFSSNRKKLIDASEFENFYTISSDGSRVCIGARGEIFSLPAKDGITRNLTNSSNANDRNPEWSPDGKWIAYISDQTGEDELYIINQDGSEAAKQLTKGGGSYKFNPWWSPDSKYILLGDRLQNLYLIDINTGTQTIIHSSDGREMHDYTWAPDSKWMAFSTSVDRSNSVIFLYNIDTKEKHQVTETWYESDSPSFDPDGKYLYFISRRDFNPVYSSTEWNHAYQDMEKVYVMNLRKDVKSPFELENDEIEFKDEKKEEGKKDDKKVDKKEEDKKEDKTLKIDFDRIDQRIQSLPISSANYWNTWAVSGGIYYGHFASSSEDAVTKYFDLESKEETEVGNFSGFMISSNGKKMIIGKGNSYYLENVKTEGIKLKNKIDASGMKIWVDQKQEWQQIFNESWRQMRDYFYDENMHGVDWKAMHNKYTVLVPYVNHRNDLTYIIGEMIGELNCGHSYVSGGDRPSIEKVKMGLLGARYSRDKSGYYKIEKIIGGENWKTSLRSPLQEVGVNVKQGDYIIAINGHSVKDLVNLNEALIGKAGRSIELTVNSKPSTTDTRTVLVKPIADESSLYYYDWVEKNIAKVSEASNGEIGYLHIPDMGVNGLNQFARYFYPQLNKKALIVDDRGNGGGNVSPMIIERLKRQISMGVIARNSKITGTKPAQMILGPKLCLINQYSASDGDLFPYQFKQLEIGKVLGQRSWGGVVGIRGSLPFIDGGSLHKPEFAHFDATGSEFVIEGYGVDPDIEVINDPHQEFKGIDKQLDRAIEELKKELREHPVSYPKIPPYPDKSK